LNVRFGFFTAMKIQDVVFWLVTPYSDVGGDFTLKMDAPPKRCYAAI
jgi:hypothetical protein